MRSHPRRTDSGFTLVELLIVMVVMPLVVAAIAVAIITTEKNAGTTKARLTDSANAQISSEYFVPDVQSAQLVTLPKPNSKLPNSIVPTTTIPPVCGSGTAFLLGIYRSIGATTGVSVGYWVTTPSVGPATLTRYTCTVTPAPGTSILTAGLPTQVLISDDINPASQLPATISPSQFATAASAGWTAVSTSATVTTTTRIPALPGTFFLPVTPTTNGFNLSQQLSVITSAGNQSVNCAGSTVSTFTGCSSTSGSQLTAAAGSQVTQPASLSGVNLSVFEPGSSYSYRLTAVPRTYAVVGSSGVGGAGVGAPALLTLGGGDTINGGSGARLTVNGNVTINDGTLTCMGTPLPVVSAWGYGATSGPSAFSPSSCATGGPTTTQPAIPDPYANLLPTYGSTQFPRAARINSIPPGGNCRPGEYTVTFNCTTLSPGVYILDRGLRGLSTTSITMNGSPGGVLLYLPCRPPGAPSTCNEAISTGSNLTLNLRPLSASQSGQFFGTTALQGVTVWQDKGNSAAASIGGSSSAISLGGTVYLPSAVMTIQPVGAGSLSAGGVVAQSITMAMGASATIQP